MPPSRGCWGGRCLSSRAIAPVVGAHHATVARDMESVADATDAPRTVKSIDGVGGTRELVRTGHLSGSPLDPHGLDSQVGETSQVRQMTHLIVSAPVRAART